MSDFLYVTDAYYDKKFGQFDFSFGPAALSDKDNDDQFESGDIADKGVYAGTATIKGIAVPVFQVNFHYIAYFPTDPGDLTGTTIGTITNAPYVFCFAAGTRIDTPNGAQPVEDLRIGDPVCTADGRSIPVKWIGRQTVSTLFRPAERLSLVTVAKGALGEGVPVRDLTVTTDHALLIDGVLCQAGALVNGSTIRRLSREECGESYTVYHVETEDHEIILAEGAPAETFIDNVSRRVFDNYAEFEALYGDVPEMVEMDLPRAMSARQLPERIKAKLAGKAAA